jgi:hypothetical protein
LNAGLHFSFLKNKNNYIHQVRVSLLGYDLLARFSPENEFLSRNTLRWQSAALLGEGDLYGLDVQSVACRIGVDF